MRQESGRGKTSPTSRITPLQEGKQKDKTLMTQRDTRRQEEGEKKRQQYETPPVRSFWSEGKGFTPHSPPDEVAHWVTPLSTCSQTARETATWTKTDRQTD